jgi:TolA-binding protein/peptidoglycan/xylan/chitin deacetylase (PgdA/CDA1 family)
VDVDTRRGLDEGVPRLVALFDRLGLRASFFVTMGPDRTGLALRRAWRPSFLVKAWRSRAWRLYGLRTLLRGTLLPAVPVGAGAPTLLRALASAGHEVAPHGFDHVAWQDRVHRMSAPRVRADLRAAAEAYAAALGRPPAASAAPGWRTAPLALVIQDEFGYRYASDVRGDGPFRPVVDGRVLVTVQVPTTVPTLDELLGRTRDPAEVVTAALRPGLNVLAFHAEVEGGPWLRWAETLLGRLVRRGIAAGPVGEVAGPWLACPEALPARPVRRGRVPGRSGWLAVAGSALLGIVLLAPGCAGPLGARRPPPADPGVVAAAPEARPPTTELAGQLARLRGELGELENALGRLAATLRAQEERLGALERRLRDLAAPGAPAPERGAASPQPPSPPAQPARSPGVTAPSAPLGPASPPPAAPEGTSRPAPASPGETLPQPGGRAETLFESAEAQRRSGDRERARLAFYELIADYPHHPLRARAQLAVADLYYEEGDYRAALEELESVLAAAPRGPHVPEALLKLGLCRRALGDDAGARRAWERLVRDHPRSEAARQARGLLRGARGG